MDHNVITLSTMEQTFLLQPVMAGREVQRELGAAGPGVGWKSEASLASGNG